MLHPDLSWTRSTLVSNFFSISAKWGGQSPSTILRTIYGVCITFNIKEDLFRHASEEFPIVWVYSLDKSSNNIAVESILLSRKLTRDYYQQHLFELVKMPALATRFGSIKILPLYRMFLHMFKYPKQINNEYIMDDIWSDIWRSLLHPGVNYDVFTIFYEVRNYIFNFTSSIQIWTRL